MSRLLKEKLRETSARLLRGYLPRMPVLIGIEPTTRCNLSCRMCVRQHWDGEQNPWGDMTLEMFQRNIYPFIGRRQTINLQCLGEPLLNESFFAMARACKKKGSRVIFTTNGTLLKKFAPEIVQAGIDAVTLSVDGIALLKNIRGIDIGVIADGIDALRTARKECGARKPDLHINFVALKENIADLPEVIGFAAQREVVSVTVLHAIIYARELKEQSLWSSPSAAGPVFEAARLKARQAGISLFLPSLREREYPCTQPLTTLYINWNGDVRPCCSATLNEKGTLKLGNLRDASIPRLWNSAYMRTLRSALLRGRNLPAFCRACPFRVASAESHMRSVR